MMDATHDFAAAKRLRAERVITLKMAIEDAVQEDAVTVCCLFLDQISAGMPPLDPWGDLRADAAFWADIAHPAEVEVYFSAALRRLGLTFVGLNARKRLFRDIWVSFTEADRAAFLAHVRRAA